MVAKTKVKATTPAAAPEAPKKKKAVPVVVEEDEDEEEEEGQDLELMVGEESEDEDEEEEVEEVAPRSRHPSAKSTTKPSVDGHRKKGSSARQTLDISDTMTGEDWQKILDQVSGSGGMFYFLKEGKTRLRLVAEPGSKNRWFIETESSFKGTTRAKMIALAVLQSGKGVTDEMKTKVTPIILSKTVVRAILALLAEGYNLLSPTKGYGVTINRTGAALDTTYNVLPSQEPRPLPSDLTWPEIKTLSELADEYESNQRSRDSQRRGNNRGDDSEGDDDW